MDTPAAVIEANYSDFRFVKSRGVAQIVLEIDIAKADAFLAMFKAPQPGHERPVAVALLQDGVAGQAPLRQGAARTTRPARADSESDTTVSHDPQADAQAPSPQPAAPDKLVQRVAILCGETPFQEWLWSITVPGSKPAWSDRKWLEEISAEVRNRLGVASRRELSTNPAARQRAEALLLRYDQHCGRAAVDWRSA